MQNRAYVDLGLLLVEGDGLKKDVQRGLEFLQLAAERKYRRVQFVLCRLYLSGETVPADAEKSRPLL